MVIESTDSTFVATSLGENGVRDPDDLSVSVTAVPAAVDPATRQPPGADLGTVLAAILRCATKGVAVTSAKESSARVVVSGHGKRREDVSDFVRAVATLVSTPRGVGRVLERSVERRTVRVQLVEGGGREEDFAETDVANVKAQLLRADSVRSDSGPVRIDFELLVEPK